MLDQPELNGRPCLHPELLSGDFPEFLLTQLQKSMKF